MTEPTDREKQAAIEAGRTEFQPGVAWFLVFFLSFVMGAVPLVDAVRSPEAVAGARHVFPSQFEIERVIEEEGLARGAYTINRRLHRNMAQLENNLEQTSILRDVLLRPMNQVLSERLGARNADVCRGKAGWLFYGPALDHLTGPPFMTRYADGNSPVTVLSAFSAQLAARGVTLIVMPVPVKASLYPERFTTAYDGQMPIVNPAHEAFLTGLKERGVLICDPTEALLHAKREGPVYLARDSHWTPRGQQTAVARLGELIREQQWINAASQADYRYGPAAQVENHGDLHRLLYPGHSDDGARESVDVRPVLAPDGEAWEPDRNSPVLLLGDSFANIYGLETMGWGTGSPMAAALSVELQVPVDAITQNGDGAFATRLALKQEQAQGRDRLAGKRVVVFVFSARELSFGDWKPELEQGALPQAS